MHKTKLIYGSLLVFWAGMVTGVSLLSAPIKFLVPDMSRELELQLGSLTFRYFNYIEWLVFAVILLALILVLKSKQLKRTKLVLSLTVLLGLILVMDSFYLLPELHAYVAALMDPQASVEGLDIGFYHRLYVLGDFSKVFLQLALLIGISTPQGEY